MWCCAAVSVSEMACFTVLISVIVLLFLSVLTCVIVLSCVTVLPYLSLCIHVSVLLDLSVCRHMSVCCCIYQCVEVSGCWYCHCFSGPDSVCWRGQSTSHCGQVSVLYLSMHQCWYCHCVSLSLSFLTFSSFLATPKQSFTLSNHMWPKVIVSTAGAKRDHRYPPQEAVVFPSHATTTSSPCFPLPPFPLHCSTLSFLPPPHHFITPPPPPVLIFIIIIIISLSLSVSVSVSGNWQPK